jgi:hypothetical protein
MIECIHIAGEFMKKIIVLFLALSSVAMAGETQILEGEVAYQKYLSLPGASCQEYKLENYLVLSKYQTKSCQDSQPDASKWNCTVQFAMKKGKKSDILNASCSREIL